MKHVDLEKPTTFLDQLYLGCNQLECKPNKKSRRRIQEHVRITDFRRVIEKAALVLEI